VRLCSILFAALLTLVACSSATSGHGALSSPGSPPAPSATSSATTLDCPATAITKTGAPFCYERPPGFTDNSSLNSYGGKWAYKTLVSTARYDLVEVLASRLSFDSDAYSDAKLAAYADPGRGHPCVSADRDHAARGARPGDLCLPRDERGLHPVRAPRPAVEGRRGM
jgi:hypothetical protein